VELTQSDVERDWPGWRVWRNTFSGACFALHRTGPAIEARGEDWTDLADQIRRAEAHIANDDYARGRHH